MDGINIADAQAAFSELVERAANGESISITKQGRPIARLVPAEAPREPIDFDELEALTAEAPRKPVDVQRLRALTGSMSGKPEDSGTFMRRMRDDARY